jgi:hypothetical protein
VKEEQLRTQNWQFKLQPVFFSVACQKHGVCGGRKYDLSVMSENMAWLGHGMRDGSEYMAGLHRITKTWQT